MQSSSHLHKTYHCVHLLDGLVLASVLSDRAIKQVDPALQVLRGDRAV
jgi:hypothetical protein